MSYNFHPVSSSACPALCIFSQLLWFDHVICLPPFAPWHIAMTLEGRVLVNKLWHIYDTTYPRIQWSHCCVCMIKPSSEWQTHSQNPLAAPMFCGCRRAWSTVRKRHLYSLCTKAADVIVRVFSHLLVSRGKWPPRRYHIREHVVLSTLIKSCHSRCSLSPDDVWSVTQWIVPQ